MGGSFYFALGNRPVTPARQRKKKNTARGRGQAAQGSLHRAPSPAKHRGQTFTGKRAWCLRIALAVLSPILFFLLLEGCLLVLGVGSPASFFVPADRPGLVTPNQMFIWFYRANRSTSPHPCLIHTPKPAQDLRLFVLGGSAAMGTPQPAYGFARILELMLQDAFPGQRVEVINAAMRGINSHILVPIADACAELEPDLMIIYAGNNEFTGRYGADTFWGRYPRFIPLLHAAKRPRTSQWIRHAIQGIPGTHTDEEQAQDMPFFREQRMTADFPHRDIVYRNYKANLTEICRRATAQGAEVLILTLPVNLRDWAPVGALHRPDLSADELARWESLYRTGITHEDSKDYQQALVVYQEALSFDDHHADLHYRLGRCYLAMDQIEHASRHFSLARDWDALQFRTDSRLNDTIRSLVAQTDSHQVHLLDAAQQWAGPEVCDDGIPGGELFNDHVHFSFRGDYEMARTLLPAAVAALEKKRGVRPASSFTTPSQEDVARRLAYTALDHLNILTSVTRMAAAPPFADRLDYTAYQARAQQALDSLTGTLTQPAVELALQTYRQAIAARPQDWNLRFGYANHLYQLKRYGDTAVQMQEVVRAFPNIASFRILLGYSLAATGSVDQAMVHFRHARSLGTHNEAAQKALDHFRRR
jgi:tetratricopeptide (TPR) repeat protein